MKIFIFHANAGHGHKKVAEVLASAFQKHSPAAQVQVFDALDFTVAAFRKSYPTIYFYMVKYAPFLWGWGYELLDIDWIYRSVRCLRSAVNRFWGGKLLRFAQKENPDIIIFTHFFSAEVLATAKKKGILHSKLITVITDFLPHTFWVNEGTDYYWVMNEKTKTDLVKRGVHENQIIAGGIPVDPIFKPKGNRKEILQKYGFTLDRLTLLFSSGSFGLAPYSEILKNLEEFSDRLQCFIVCGKNSEMKESLEKQTFPFPVKIFGFVDFMAELMEASDLLLAKSGGATTVESLAKGIPMIVLHPIPGQETRNANYLKSANASFFMEAPYQIRPIVYTVLKYPDLLKSKKDNVKRAAHPDAAHDFVKFLINSASGK